MFSHQQDEAIIHYVEDMLQTALQKSASDIHIEPHENFCRIRYRQEGILQEIAKIPLEFATRIMTRLKVIAKLDIAEKRLPQDGRFPFSTALHTTDIRINSCPTLYGEKLALRLLSRQHHPLAVEQLGMTLTQQQLFLEKISQPQGLILVTGPTGSGKTVTLYTALQYLNTIEKNISTAEDPVEIQLPGINQVPVNPKIGLDFASALRTFLRQDPDILMIGEIRDADTAEIALQAAQTGHLVFSTLHTNSALETIVRLQAMGVPPYHLINSLTLIIAQRLVRKLCPHCKIQSPHPPFTYTAHHCHQCNQGYLGRTAIYEMLPLTTDLIQKLLAGVPLSTLTMQVQQAGYLTLKQIAAEKVQEGITSLTEIQRVL